MTTQEKVRLEIELPASELKIDHSEDSAEHEQAKSKASEAQAEPTIAGYKPEDILAAPLAPPEPVDKRTPNIHQKRAMMLGLVLIFLSAFCAAFSLAVGLGIALAGAIVVASSTLVRI